MNNKLKLTLTIGALMSLPVLLMAVLSYVFDLNGSLFNWVNIIVWVLTIFFGQYYFRNTYYNGFATYGQLFGSTFIMICVASVILSLYTFILYKFIAPDLIENILNQSTAILYENNMFSDEQIEAAIKMNSRIISPPFMAMSSLFGYIIRGTIIALITSAINMRKGDGFNQAMRQISDDE